MAIHHHVKKWIAKMKRSRKRGTLHRKLRVPMSEKIPVVLLRRASHIPGRLGHEALFALTARKFKHFRKARHHATR